MINWLIDVVFDRALSHNNEHMGKRYIEVFESKYSEMEWVVTRMQGGQSDSEGVVRLRGLPYGAQKQDIAEFFAGMPLRFNFPYIIACLIQHLMARNVQDLLPVSINILCFLCGSIPIAFVTKIPKKFQF